MKRRRHLIIEDCRFRHLAAVVALALGTGAALAQETPPAGAPPAPPPVRDVERLVRERPLGEKAVRIDEISRTEAASVHLAQIRGEVPPNYHLAHDELVFIWRGKGTLRLGDGSVGMEAGSHVLIPRRTVHAYKNDGPEPTVAILVFAPGFDGKDRVDVPPGGGLEPELNLLLREHAALVRRGGARTPYSDFMLDGVSALPLIDALPADARRFEIEVHTAPGPAWLVISAVFARSAGSWRVEESRWDRQSAEGGRIWEIERKDRAAAEVEIARIYGRGFFDRKDPTDLRAWLREAVAKDPVAAQVLGPIAATMPSVSGFWASAARVYLKWQAGDGPERAIVFAKGPDGAWALAPGE